jgi:O-antigen/teichoic acid export membrane protein
MTPNHLGEAMLALGGMALLDALISSSINQVVFYFGSKDNLKVKVFEKLVMLRKYALLLGGGLIFFVLVLLLIFPAIKNIKCFFVIIVLLCYVVIEPSRSSLCSFLNVNASRSRYGVQVTIDAILAFIITFLALLYEPHWVFLILGMLSARFLSILMNSWLLTKPIKNLPKLADNNIQIAKKDVYKHIQPIMLMGILGWITGYADRYIIAGVLSIVQTGYYSIATGLVGKPYIVLGSAYTAYFKPSLFTAYSTNDRKSIDRNVFLWLFAALIIGIIGTILFVFLGDFVVKLLLSVEYRGRIENILWILALGLTFSIATQALDNKFLAAGRGNKLLFIHIWFLPISLLMVGIGAYYQGMSGAVYGKLFSMVIRLIFTGIYSKKI